MQISIITLNYNGSENTIKLIRSLENQTDKNFQIIVVDNASEEADFIRLQEVIHIPTSQVGYPQIQVVRNRENLGFSGGNNVGIRQALNPSTGSINSLQAGSGQETGSDWVVLLNNDTWVERDFIEHLKGILNVKEGVVGIPLIESDRTAYCGKIQWLKPTLIHIPTSSRWLRQSRESSTKSGQSHRGSSIESGQVGYPQVYVIGGAMAVHRNVFEKIGLLDQKYFLYFEDADFSVRARKAKFDISVAGNLNVQHNISSSTKKLGSPLLLRYHYRNALYFNLKNGPWYIKLAVWSWSWIIIAKQLVKLTLKKNTNQSKAILDGVIDFYLCRFGKIK